MEKETIRAGVLDLLKNDVRCRNDDKYLIWRFLREKAGVNIFIPFNEFEKMPSFESIRRMRQEIQNTEQKFPPTSSRIREKRKISEEEWKSWLIRAKTIWGVEY